MRYMEVPERVSEILSSFGLQVYEGILNDGYLVEIPSWLYGTKFALAVIFGILSLRNLLTMNQNSQ